MDKKKKRKIVLGVIFGIIALIVIVFVAVTVYQNVKYGKPHVEKLENGVTMNYYLQKGDESYRVDITVENANTDLVIPDTYKDLPVMKFYIEDDSKANVGGLAFNTKMLDLGKYAGLGDYTAPMELPNLRWVSLPEGIIEIPESFCKGLTNLTTVNIPSTTVSIRKWAFYGCTNLTVATFANPNGWYTAKAPSDKGDKATYNELVVDKAVTEDLANSGNSKNAANFLSTYTYYLVRIDN
jgi:hypothetical protein